MLRRSSRWTRFDSSNPSYRYRPSSEIAVESGRLPIHTGFPGASDSASIGTIVLPIPGIQSGTVAKRRLDTLSRASPEFGSASLRIPPADEVTGPGETGGDAGN